MINDAQEGTTVTLTQVYTGRAGDATASPRCACASLQFSAENGRQPRRARKTIVNGEIKQNAFMLI